MAYDARGHGESSPAPDGLYGYPELVADLEAVLDERGIDRCVLAGSSMGAATAMAFALDNPARVDALVQITPAYDGEARTGASSLEGWDARADALAAGDVDAFVELTGVSALPERFRDSARTAVRQRAERHEHPEAVAEALRQVPRSAAFDGLDRLASVDVPVLVVASRDDTDPEHPLAIAREYASTAAERRAGGRGRGGGPARLAGRSAVEGDLGVSGQGLRWAFHGPPSVSGRDAGVSPKGAHCRPSEKCP